MLHELERKLTAVVGEALAARPQVDVVQATGEAPAPPVGRGRVAVGLSALTAAPAFASGLLRDAAPPAAGAGESPRVVPVAFEASLLFGRRAAAATPAALGEARTLLLEDASIVAHALGADGVSTGTAFVSAAPDPGFEVRAFGLAAGALALVREDQTLRASLTYAGHGVVWPPAVAGPADTIVQVEPLTEPLPLAIEADDRVVVAGGSTTIRVRSGAATRGPRAPAQRTAPRFAVAVVSDLPPADRGAIATGEPGQETGLRLVPVAAETAIAYQAPVGDLGATRSELVAVHLARADGTKGILLGSIAIGLTPGAP